MRALSKILTSLVVVAMVAAIMNREAISAIGYYKFDTVTFVVSGEIPEPDGPTPNLHIDTNVDMSSMLGGTIKSTKPYSIGFDYTDETHTFAKAEITKLKVTYKDGTSDKLAAALKLPLTIASREYVATNSVSGGKIVKTKLRVISTKIQDVISKDRPMTLVLEGFFVKEDGTKIPFAIKRDYDVVTDNSTKPWAEVMSDA